MKNFIPMQQIFDLNKLRFYDSLSHNNFYLSTKCRESERGGEGGGGVTGA